MRLRFVTSVLCIGGRVRTSDPHTCHGRGRARLPRDGRAPIQLAWSPAHPELLASGGLDGSLRLWDLLMEDAVPLRPQVSLTMDGLEGGVQAGTDAC